MSADCLWVFIIVAMRVFVGKRGFGDAHQAFRTSYNVGTGSGVKKNLPRGDSG